jgi:hypothetical protein
MAVNLCADPPRLNDDPFGYIHRHGWPFFFAQRDSFIQVSPTEYFATGQRLDNQGLISFRGDQLAINVIIGFLIILGFAWTIERRRRHSAVPLHFTVKTLMVAMAWTGFYIAIQTRNGAYLSECLWYLATTVCYFSTAAAFLAAFDVAGVVWHWFANQRSRASRL